MQKLWLLKFKTFGKIGLCINFIDQDRRNSIELKVKLVPYSGHSSEIFIVFLVTDTFKAVSKLATF